MKIDAKASASIANPIAVITWLVTRCVELVWSSITMDVRFESDPVRVGERFTAVPSSIRLELYSTARV